MPKIYRTTPTNHFLFLALIFSALLIGCRPATTIVSDFAATDQSLLETADAQLQTSTSTITATPTSTPTQTLTHAPTLAPTPTPHPLEIGAMRAGSYPGSDIVIEQELDPGANYRRYYAYYLSEGYKIYALLTVPNGETPEGGWPAIVFNHGYIPPAQYRTTERYVAYVDGLARNGYIVFRIDYRGHDRSEGSPSGAYSNPGYMVDVLNAVSSLQRFPQANPDKIGMWGHSMGGYLTLRAMVISDAVRAGVIWAGVVGSYPDLLYNWRRGSSSAPIPTPHPGSRRWRDWVEDYGSPEENPAFWNSISANAFLSDLSGPVQLHHGTADQEVPSEFSFNLSAQIQAVGGEVELYQYEGDNHNISNYFSTA
ncbi:MAG: alpha/beta fold hydrolase, partial [Anaerolineaceae bacterium]|nr:alpha/beta fold hydrolase [Anaerolineaceae bacterium]